MRVGLLAQLAVAGSGISNANELSGFDFYPSQTMHS